MIEVSDLSVHDRADQVLLDSVTLSVPAGRIVACVAHDSERRTALVRVLSGMQPISSGRVRIAGIDPSGHALDARRHAAFIHEGGTFEGGLTLRQHVRWVLKLCGVTRSSLLTIEYALRDTDVPDDAFDRSAAELSLNLRPLTWLAIAALRAVPVIVWHDPPPLTSPVQMGIWRDRLADARGRGVAVLVVAPDLHVARALADDVTSLGHT
jgi:ABC-2 type transport system ATP-binding protein